MTSKQEPATDEVHAWNRPGDSIEQIAQNIMDEACLGIAYYQNGVVSALQATIVSALHATREQAVRECAEKWNPIETAPEVAGKYFFCRLAWGPEDDKCAGEGFRWNGHWFVGAKFYIGGPFDGCQYEIRQTKINPTHWQPIPTPPLIDRGRK